MNYPSISDYIQALRAPKDNFGKQLKHLQLVLDGTNQPVTSRGIFAVVFKMTDGKRFYALKCFTKEQAGRDEAYRQIAEELSTVQSPFLVHFDYYEAALSVNSRQTDETKFPVLLMDWVDGVPLDKYITTIAHNREARERLLHELQALMSFLLPQRFAHGDLEPDNILVQKDGRVKLLDYDGMYVPAMGGQAREAGNPQYRPRLLQELPFDRHIDDYAAVLILLLAAYNVHTPCDFNDLLKDDPTEFVSQFRDFVDDPFICSLLTAYLLAATQGKLEIPVISALVLYMPWRKGSQGSLMDSEVMSELMKSLTDATINGHAYVDLGLSVKWATCNVGASSPEDYGDCYAWGETSIKASYGEGNCKTNKRGYSSDIGGDASLDAARAKWGGTWRLPTKAEALELSNNCIWTKVTQGGTKGFKLTGPNGRSIFLPAAGSRIGASLDHAGSEGNYWTSTPDEDKRNNTTYRLLFALPYGLREDSRDDGYSVRPVSETVTNDHACVDLGLSVMWATCNVGAPSPEDYGDYFAWGETSVKKDYNMKNSKTYNNGSYNYDIGGDASLDAARAKWGGTWRLPTESEMKELIDKCTWALTTQRGRNGFKVTGPNGQSIFLPAAGFMGHEYLCYEGQYGRYWASTPGGRGSYHAYSLGFNFTNFESVSTCDRKRGRSVRPVSE